MEAETPAEEDFLTQLYEQMYGEEAEEELVASAGRVVRVSQTPRNTGRSDLKKAQLPRFSRPIERGPHDVNISNTFSYDVKVGLRTGNKRGKNFSIPADGTATVYLPNDTYDLYYIDADTPDTLEHSGSFTVASPPFSIFLNLR